MQIADIPHNIFQNIEQLKFDSLKLSYGEDISKLCEICLKHNIYSDIGDSREKFIASFKIALTDGTCDGQVRSFFLRNCEEENLKSVSHISDSIIFQMVYELKFDVKKLLQGHLVTSPEVCTYPTVIARKNTFSTIYEVKQACLELLEKIKMINKKVFQGFRRVEIISVPGTIKSLSGTVVLKKFKTEEIKKILGKYSTARVSVHIKALNNKANHTVAIVKRDNKFMLYNSYGSKKGVLETRDSVKKLFITFQNAVNRMYIDGVSTIRFKVYIPN